MGQHPGLHLHTRAWSEVYDKGVQGRPHQEVRPHLLHSADWPATIFKLPQGPDHGHMIEGGGNWRAGRTSLSATEPPSRLQVPPPAATNLEGLYIEPGTS
jgi:hypothetical protein